MKPVSGAISKLTKDLVRIKGPDASKFLNGLVTSRLFPTVVKKKEHTITEDKNADLSNVIDVSKNWGLIHEDIYDPDKNVLVGRDGVNSMFLNSKGRILTDCFIHPVPFHNLNDEHQSLISVPQYLVEIDPGLSRQLQMLLKLHKLSADVQVEKLDSLYSYYFYNDTLEFDDYLDKIQENYFQSRNPIDALDRANSFMRSDLLFNKNISRNILSISFDNRIPNFGVKFITDIKIDFENNGTSNDVMNIDDVFSSNFRKEYPFTVVSEDDLTYRRFKSGLFEIQDAPRGMSLLPFEANIDYYNGLSLDKGCYVGQELTIRTFNNGVIRKRILPVEFFDINHPEGNETTSEEEISLRLNAISKSNLPNLVLTPLEQASEEKHEPDGEASYSPFGSSKFVRRRKVSSGKIFSVQGNIGFALMHVSEIESNNYFKLEVPCLNEGEKMYIGVKVEFPDWWPLEE